MTVGAKKVKFQIPILLAISNIYIMAYSKILKIDIMRMLAPSDVLLQRTNGNIFGNINDRNTCH